jgi:hypothetical protein
MKTSIFRSKFLFMFALLIASTIQVAAQTTSFTYQGKLTDSAATAQGNYQMEFKLFGSAGGADQIGAALSNSNIAVNQGIFTVNLDFGADVFTGADRFLQISVRRTSGESFTMLNPRQQITSSPYAIRTLRAAQADIALDANKLGGIEASQYVTSSSVGNSFIRNSTTAQAGANFNIDGSGNIGNSLGIGVAAAQTGIRLDINGNSVFRTANGNVNIGTPNSETGITITNANRADFRFNGSALKLVAGLGTGVPADTNGIVINTLGDVGIGTATPSAKLDVNALAEDGLRVSSNKDYAVNAVNIGFGNGIQGISLSNVSGARGVYGLSNGGIGVEGVSNGGNNFGVFASGFLGTNRLGTAGNTQLCLNFSNQIASCSSSLRYKKDLETFSGGLSFINQLRPIAYKWKTDNASDIGFGAEDMAKINPLFVTYNSKGEVEGVKYDRLSVVFVNAFKEQQRQIERQEEKIKNQQSLVDKQQRQINALTHLFCLQNTQAEICREQ